MVDGREGRVSGTFATNRTMLTHHAAKAPHLRPAKVEVRVEISMSSVPQDVNEMPPQTTLDKTPRQIHGQSTRDLAMERSRHSLEKQALFGMSLFLVCLDECHTSVSSRPC